MVPKLFVFSKIFGFYRLPCELENVRVLYKIRRKFDVVFSVNTKYISSRELKT